METISVTADAAGSFFSSSFSAAAADAVTAADAAMAADAVTAAAMTTAAAAAEV